MAQVIFDDTRKATKMISKEASKWGLSGEAVSRWNN